MPTLQSGCATPYARMPAPLAQVAVAERDRLWGGLAIYPQKDVAKSLFLISERVRVPVGREPTKAPAGFAAVQGVNCCRQTARFDLKPAGKPASAPTTVEVAPMASRNATTVKAGLYDVVATTQDGRKVRRQVALAGGCGYSAAIYTKGDKLQMAFLSNTLSKKLDEQDAHRCGPMMASKSGSTLLGGRLGA